MSRNELKHIRINKNNFDEGDKMYVYREEDIRQIDATAESEGFSLFTLMENAGRNVTERIVPFLKKEDRIAIIAGTGNNGGDGIVIARYLQLAGYDVSLFFPLGEPKTAVAQRHFTFYKKQQYNVTDWHERGTYDVIIDALLGVGVTLPLRERAVQIITWCNEQDALKIAIDIPTGTEADSGYVDEQAVFAAHQTICLHGYKQSAFLLPAKRYYGKVTAVSIGLKETGTVKVISEEDVKATLPLRDENAHKGTYGTSLLIAGSDEMPGSALLCAIGAIKCGTGKLTIATTKLATNTIVQAVPEATFMHDGIERLVDGEWDEKIAAVGIGPGLTDRRAIDRVFHTLRDVPIPLVIDAGALYKRNDWKRDGPTILTPHPGEMSRLTGISVRHIEANRMEVASTFAKENDVTVVLKGAHTVVAFSDGRVAINMTGNSGLAKGGSGDVLTGMIVSMLTTHEHVADAVRNAVYIHGLCADLWSEQYSEESMVASDFRTLLPKLMHHFQSKEVDES